MTERPPNPEMPAMAQSPPPAGGQHSDVDPTDAERFGVLVEMSLRGALGPEEQRELGAMLASSPQLAELAQHLQQEDRTMQTMITDAQTAFDPERARRSIEAKLQEARTHCRLLPLLIVVFVGGTVALVLLRGRVDWPILVVGAAIMTTVLVVQALWSRHAARRLAAEAATGDEGLELAFRRREQDVRHWTLLYRLLAIAAPVITLGYLIGVLADESTSTTLRWIVGTIFVLTLPNLWFAFNRRNVERIRARMLGHRDESTPDRDARRSD